MTLIESLACLTGSLPAIAVAATGSPVAAAVAAAREGPAYAGLIPLLPIIGAVLCVLCAVFKVRSKLPAFLTVGLLGASFVLSVMAYLAVVNAGGGPLVTHSLDWFRFSWGTGPGETFVASFGFYLDSLTALWMLFVTGLATLIALYASEYMSHDQGTGYCRFFFAFNLFVFSMACLVMGDSLLLMFLGWEGVGLCSYLLIGYFYTRPAAVAAAKKAFIMNRIGDLALLMGMMTTFVLFGTIEYVKMFPMVSAGVDANGAALPEWAGWVLPLLFMIGAFGKSAQLFFYVWLPDAMEGPTPVSALIHAATMVTAGVYLIARLYPVFLIDESRTILTVVAWSGAITAFWAATIGMAQYDIKRVMGYSTVSQLGFMFAGLGVMSTYGAAFHVFTHAFFKATLFLCCGAVMHGFRGQLDLRKLSGVMSMKGWTIVGLAMLVGCLNLSGFPFTAGFFSKDVILADAFVQGGGQIAGAQYIGWLLLLTAGMTAYYTFRVFFRVFLGPQSYVPGDEPDSPHGYHAAHAHGHDDHGHGHAAPAAHAAGHASGDSHGHDDHFHPHAPGWAVNTVLVILMVSTLAAAALYVVPSSFGKQGANWVEGMTLTSSARMEAGHGEAATEGASGVAAGTATGIATEAAPAAGRDAAAAGLPQRSMTDTSGATLLHSAAHGTIFGQDPHKVMYYISGLVGAVGIVIAFLLHYAGRKESATSPGADKLASLAIIRPLVVGARNKWYVDEIYNYLFRIPLLVISHIFHLIDKLLVDGLVNLVGRMPRVTGEGARVGQSGILHGYAVGMAGGIAVIVAIAYFLVN